MLRTLETAANKLFQSTPHKPPVPARPVRKSEYLGSQIQASLGHADGIDGNLFTEQKRALRREMYEAGIEEAQAEVTRASENGSPQPGQKNCFFAGSGATQEGAEQTAERLPRGFCAVKGDDWFGNIHQLMGTGVSISPQEEEMAKHIGRAQVLGGNTVLHSQANLTHRNLLQDIPEAVDCPTVHVSSPISGFSKSSMALTGDKDPIRIGRPLLDRIMPPIPAPAGGPPKVGEKHNDVAGREHFVPSGHSAKQTIEAGGPVLNRFFDLSGTDGDSS